MTYLRSMSDLSFTDARRHLGAVISRAEFAGERTYVTRRGRRVAAVVPAELLESLDALEAAEDEADVAAAKASLAEPGESVPWEKLRAELDL